MISASIWESVAEKWGEPDTTERHCKIRNSINVALGTQKARGNPSEQAIKKWVTDILYLDEKLTKEISL